MPVTVTETAANLLKITMVESGLDPNQTAVAFANIEGSLGIAFLSEFTNADEVHGLKVIVENIDEDVVLDHYEMSDGRKGLIYLGADEMAVPPPRKPSSCGGGCGCGKRSC